MDLITKNEALPLKAFPEQDLNRLILTEFTVWVANLLSLTDETSAERLEIALPAIKEHCWSMGFREIKKMFEMYADSKLSLKPIPNYFDRILLGKIVDAYKQQKVVPKQEIKPIELSDEEKRNNEILSATICFDFYIQNGYLNKSSLYLYSELLDRFDFKDKERETMVELCKNMDCSLKEQRVHYKKMCLRRYFDKLHAKGKHLKDLI